jgi:hypothetical protein
MINILNAFDLWLSAFWVVEKVTALLMCFRPTIWRGFLPCTWRHFLLQDVQPLQHPQQRIGAGAVKGASPIRATMESGGAGRHVTDAAALRPASPSIGNGRTGACRGGPVRRATSVEAERPACRGSLSIEFGRNVRLTHGRW